MTYGWCRTAYVALKSLSDRGLNVYVAGFSSTAMCRFSNLKKKFIKIPLYINTEEKYITFLIDTIIKYQIDVFIPVNEEIFIVAKHISKFPASVKIPVDRHSKLIKVHNKKSSFEHAVINNIPTPKTYLVTAPEEVWEIADRITFPAVIKNLESQGSKGVFHLKNKQELLTTFKKTIERQRLASHQFPLIQEYVKGDGYGVSCLFDHGKVKAVFTHKRVLEKFITGGPSTRRISVKNDTLEKDAIKYLSSLNWHGVAMLEFKYDEDSGKYYFLEVNPRLWGSINLPFISGVDFPYLLYRLAIGEDLQTIPDYKTGIQSNWILGDMMALVDSLLNSREKKRFLRKFINFKADGYDDFNRQDIKPLMAEFLHYFIKFLHAGNMNPI